MTVEEKLAEAAMLLRKSSRLIAEAESLLRKRSKLQRCRMAWLQIRFALWFLDKVSEDHKDLEFSSDLQSILDSVRRVANADAVPSLN